PFNPSRVVREFQASLPEIHTKIAVDHPNVSSHPCRTLTTSDHLVSLCSEVEQDTQSLDSACKHRLQKLGRAAAQVFAERALLLEENRVLFEQNNEKTCRQSSGTTVVGHAKVMSYEDIIEAQKKRDATATKQDSTRKKRPKAGDRLLSKSDEKRKAEQEIQTWNMIMVKDACQRPYPYTLLWHTLFGNMPPVGFGQAALYSYEANFIDQLGAGFIFRLDKDHILHFLALKVISKLTILTIWRWRTMSPHGKASLLCPFHKDHQLNDDLDASLDYLPGHPRIKLSNYTSLFDFIRQEVWSEDLESMSGRLWWMSKQDSGNISPLHRQKVKGRQIVITEDPRLHLVWIDNRIFLKPLPRYLTSYAFWDMVMSDPSKHGVTVKLRKAAIGYLRTYFYLIRYESDLRIAQDPAVGLVPADVTWSQYCRFSAHFDDITDDEVSGRYHYGEIRLTRLNYYAPFLLGKSHYQRVDYQYRAYFARIQGPVISAFAFFSILLNS
ncbi:hypothetical protein ZTR_10223, partial [Talaromyces verruculosus]